MAVAALLRDAKSGESLSQAWESGASKNLDAASASCKYSHRQPDCQERRSVTCNLYLATVTGQQLLYAALGDKTQASTVLIVLASYFA